jgi:2'-5' RNA ligase
VTTHAVTVPFPSLAPTLDEWRERSCTAKPSDGVPPHVTLLIPVPDRRNEIAGVLARFEPFDVAFGGFGRFDEVLWLAPAPVEPFVAMTRALMDAFPGYLPYGGGVADDVPHLTVAQADLAAAERELAVSLPLTARVTSASLFEQVEPPSWREVAIFELGGG